MHARYLLAGLLEEAVRLMQVSAEREKPRAEPHYLASELAEWRRWAAKRGDPEPLN
jgi:hypothetical protein